MTFKEKYPHLYQYRRLGEMSTDEGEDYYMKHKTNIAYEHNEEYKVNYERARLFGGLKYIERIHKIKNEKSDK